MPGIDPALCTIVECTWLDKRHEQWLRFGRPVSEHIVSRTKKVAMFRPGSIFAWIEWKSNEHGTIHSSIAIAMAVAANAQRTSHPFIRPGAEFLLHIQGWPKVASVLEAIDAVDSAGVDPCDVSPDHWRHVGNRLTAGLSYRPYSLERHKAWLRRKALEA